MCRRRWRSRAPMKLFDHVVRAFDDALVGNMEAALLDACIALDATSRKLAGAAVSAKTNYKACIREHWWLIEAMAAPGLNFEETKFENLVIPENGKPNGKPIDKPDLTDVIYHVFRCHHVHGEEVPESFALVPRTGRAPSLVIANGVLQLPTTIVWALISVSVFCRVNEDLRGCGGDRFLTWQGFDETVHQFPLRDFWGRCDEMRVFFQEQKLIRVKLEGVGDWPVSTEQTMAALKQAKPSP